MSDLLPDSRCREPIGTRIGDWELPDGRVIRLELERSYCALCGVAYGWVPKENTIHVTCLCMKCYEKDPTVFVGFVASDDQFCQDVGYELMERFGATPPTELEICKAVDAGTLGTALEKLTRDSPYPSLDNRPKR